MPAVAAAREKDCACMGEPSEIAVSVHKALPTDAGQKGGSGRSEIEALTGLRGMAAILVVAYHFWPSTGISTSWTRDTIGRGYLWVDLFFILSGHVMALNYARLFSKGFSSTVFAEFLLRRIARIYPLYGVLLGIQIAYTMAVYGNFQQAHAWAAVTADDPIRDFSANLLLAQSLGVSPSMIGQAWSISTELAAYFIFPGLVALVISGGRRGVAISGLLAVSLILVVAAIDMHDGAYHSGPLDAYDGTRVTPLLRCLGGFLMGMVTFRLSSNRAIAAIVSRDSVALGVIALLVVLLSMGAPDLMVVAVFPMVVLCLSMNVGMPAEMFSNPIMYTLGILSYSVYLLHPLLQKPLEMTSHMLASYLPHGVTVVLSLIGAMIVLLTLAKAAHIFIEQPGRRAIQHVAKRVVPGSA
jgi:peptidoglycan/LPS O-acetylase OafA/YrhL